MGYRLTHKAQNDLEAIADYIAEQNPPAAVRLVRFFIQKWEVLATQPFSGQACEELHPGVRRLVMGAYVAFYRVEDRNMLILRVLHGRRDITPEDFAE